MKKLHPECWIRETGSLKYTDESVSAQWVWMNEKSHTASKLTKKTKKNQKGPDKLFSSFSRDCLLIFVEENKKKVEEEE